jgi:hypothetical protein
MEWLILLLLAPAIVVPVVLLFGFAGCSYEPTRVDPDPDPPHTVTPPTVTADPKNVDHITVSWQNTDPKTALNYRFVRTGPVGDDRNIDGTITAVEDTGLGAATDYAYQVSTTTSDGTSELSTAVMASTFQPAFQVDPVAPTSQPGFAGDFCFVQRISAGKLLAGGGKAGIKVRGAINHNVTVNRIYISRVAGGGNLWDSAGDLTKVMDSLLGDSPLMLQDDETKDLDPVPYNLDKNQDLIVAFDFTATSGADTIRVVSPLFGVTSYFKAGVQQASVPIRETGYSTGPSQIYLVVTIGVP